MNTVNAIKGGATYAKTAGKAVAAFFKDIKEGYVEHKSARG